MTEFKAKKHETGHPEQDLSPRRPARLEERLDSAPPRVTGIVITPRGVASGRRPPEGEMSTHERTGELALSQGEHVSSVGSAGADVETAIERTSGRDQRKGVDVASRLQALLKAYEETNPANVEEFGKLLRRYEEDGSLHQKENQSLEQAAGRDNVMQTLKSALQYWDRDLGDEYLNRVRDEKLATAFNAGGCFAARVSGIADALYDIEQTREMTKGTGSTTIDESFIVLAGKSISMLDHYVLKLKAELERLRKKEAESTEAVTRFEQGSPESKGAKGKHSVNEAALKRFKLDLKGCLLARGNAEIALQWFCAAAEIKNPGPHTRKALAVILLSVKKLGGMKPRTALNATAAVQELATVWGSFDSLVSEEDPEAYKRARNTIRESPDADSAYDKLMEYLYS